MQSLTLHARVENDGILKLETPSGITNAEWNGFSIHWRQNLPRSFQ